MLPETEAALAKLKASEGDPSKYENGHGYWDDMCLALFLQGVCLRYIAYPVSGGALQEEGFINFAIGTGRGH